MITDKKMLNIQINFTEKEKTFIKLMAMGCNRLRAKLQKESQENQETIKTA